MTIKKRNIASTIILVIVALITLKLLSQFNTNSIDYIIEIDKFNISNNI